MVHIKTVVLCVSYQKNAYFMPKLVIENLHHNYLSFARSMRDVLPRQMELFPHQEEQTLIVISWTSPLNKRISHSWKKKKFEKVLSLFTVLQKISSHSWIAKTLYSEFKKYSMQFKANESKNFLQRLENTTSFLQKIYEHLQDGSKSVCFGL